MILKAEHAAADARAIASTIAQAPALTAEVAEIDPDAKLVSAVAIGPELWDVLSPRKRPKSLRPFKALKVDGHSAPSTGGDLLLHIVSKRHDLNWELAMRLRRRLGAALSVIEEVRGFTYLDSRDMTGFIDGTENPKTEAERTAVAIIGSEDADFAGGSYIFVQRWVHDLEKWRTLADTDQELIIGRRKADSVELADELKPPTAHIARVVIEENGEELHIVRHSFPYGTVSEHGLFFIAYCKTPDIPERMLGRMMGAGDGLRDRLLEFSRAVSGAHFFAPSLQTLKALA